MASDSNPGLGEKTSSQQEAARWRSGPGPREWIRPSPAWRHFPILPADTGTLQVQSNNTHSVPAGLTSILRETPTRTEGRHHEKAWETGPAPQLPQEPEGRGRMPSCLQVLSPPNKELMLMPAVRSSTHLGGLGESYVLSALVSSAGKEIKSCILPVDSFQINVQSSIKHSLDVK